MGVNVEPSSLFVHDLWLSEIDLRLIESIGRQRKSRAKIRTMQPQRIDLDGVSLERSGDDLIITHHKTGTRATVTAASLVRWLTRQIRALF